jgi:hypothetical protein
MVMRVRLSHARDGRCCSLYFLGNEGLVGQDGGLKTIMVVSLGQDSQSSG